MRSGLKITFTVLVFLLVTVTCCACFLLFTSRGLILTASYFCSRLPPGTVTVSAVEGSLARGAVLRDLRVTDIPGIPGGVVRMQEMRVSFNGRLAFSVKNGRLELPGGEILSFAGTLDSNRLNLNVYSGLVYPATILKLCGVSSRELRGRLTQADLYLTGPLAGISIKGEIRLEELYFRHFVARNFPLKIDLLLKPQSPDGEKLTGRLSAPFGIMTTRYTRMEIRDAVCVFRGDPGRPEFRARGVATVAGTRIRAVFSGSFEEPQMRLSSNPPMPQDRLLVMLLTGKSWEGTADALTEGRITPGLIKDFADFFVFGGSVQSLEKRLGITDLEVNYSRGEKGIEMHKSVTLSTGIIYGISKNKGILPQTEKQQTSTVGLEYRLNDAVSLEGRRQVTQKLDGLNPPPKTENVIRLKFKKSF